MARGPVILAARASNLVWRLLTVRLSFCVGVFVLAIVTDAPAADPPNIVYVMADDLGINDLSCYGRADQPTPNLDRLASQGARFASAYCSLSICSASRAAIMTGKMPARLHLTTYLPGRPDTPAQKLLHPEIEMQLPLAEITIAERLKELGYATGCVGKWHLGGKGFLPTDQGFDEYFPGHADTMPSATEGGKGEYELTAHAIDFIARHKKGPFYLYLAHNTPHVILRAKPELVEKHKDAFNPIYAAMMETLDDTVGLLLAALDEQGLAENTIVIFTSDNGGLHVLETPNTPSTHNTPYTAGKGYLYEGGLRIPLIVRWPGKIAPRVIDWPMTLADWTPTFVELAGGATPEGLDGVSIAAPLLGGSNPTSRSFFFHFPHYTNQGSRPSGAMRDGDWKLIERYDDGLVELFNVQRDPSEKENLAEQEPARVDEMRKRLADWKVQVNAQENTPNPDVDLDWWKRTYDDIDTARLAPRRTAAETAPLYEAWRKEMNDAVRAAKRP
jgi:arylsulfatase A-like enzyme